MTANGVGLFLLAIAVVAGLVWMRVDVLRSAKDGTWHSHDTFRKRRLVDGTWANGNLMRRWVDGGWQYRRQTKEEESEFAAATGW